MSYTSIKANHITKVSSRINIAKDMKRSAKASKKVIHYLGGPLGGTQFEDLFSNKRTTFIRYEIQRCPTPERYISPAWNKTDLKPKTQEDLGYFVRGDMFKNYEEFLYVFGGYTHHFWIDLCGMPRQKTLKDIGNVLSSVKDSVKSEIYVTFYLNHRGIKEVKDIFGSATNKEERAENLASHCRKLYPAYNCTVFETYINGKDPMGVLKLTNKLKGEL